MNFSDNSFGSFFKAHQIIKIGGLFLLLAITYIETGFSLGFVLPGRDNMIFDAGIFCGTHGLDISLFCLVVLLTAASFPGDFTRCFERKWLSGNFFTDNKSRFYKKEYPGRGNGFFNQYGIRAFNMGRYMPVICTLVPMIAECRLYQLRKNLILNLAGSKVWIGTLVPPGYFMRRSYRQIITHSAWVLLGFILIASIQMFQILIFNK